MIQNRLFPIFLLFSLLITACRPGEDSFITIKEPTPNPFTIPREDPLQCPVLSEDPTQAEFGSVVYCQVCMTCHGDVGQGLALWMQELDPPDNDCFQSNCHGPKFPPWGFQIIDIPQSVIGPGQLNNFANALELHDYLKATMPSWRPGYLKDNEYWELTAFMLEANDIAIGDLELNESNAEKVLIPKN